MGGKATLSGPDLTQGVPTDTLAPGQTLLGHADGDAVLLARLGDEYTAIGATCSHYGGPLAEGLVVGDTVRCPWHHACFSLRTGEALAAPALTNIPCWTVEQRGNRVVVTGKTEREPLASSYPHARLAAPAHIVIVGAGAAGAAAAEMLRRCGFAGTVTLVDPDEGAPYDRPNISKDYLAGKAKDDWIPLRPDGFYREHQIDLVRARVTRIDTSARHVELEAGRVLGYDRLLLATGAEPVHLGLPGEDSPHVHYLRSLNDSRAIISKAKESQRAVVIGASFIGLEVAASLRARQLDVHVVAPDAVPLERVMGAELGGFIRQLHEQKGVTFHLGRKPASIQAHTVTLDDGSTIDADVIVIGVGVRPRLALAESAGLTMDRGVSVNDRLQTSVPDVYAAGDIARWPDANSGSNIRVEHWVVAQRMGQCAARNMLGADERFSDVPFFRSAHYNVSINYVGHAEQWDRVEVDGDPSQRDVAVRFMKHDKAIALATIFRDTESLRFEASHQA